MQISRTFNGFFFFFFFFLLTLFASNILYKLILDSFLKQVSFNTYYILYFKWLSLLRPYDWPLKNIGLLRSWSYPYPKNKPLCNIALHVCTRTTPKALYYYGWNQLLKEFCFWQCILMISKFFSYAWHVVWYS